MVSYVPLTPGSACETLPSLSTLRAGCCLCNSVPRDFGCKCKCCGRQAQPSANRSLNHVSQISGGNVGGDDEASQAPKDATPAAEPSRSVQPPPTMRIQGTNRTPFSSAISSQRLSGTSALIQTDSPSAFCPGQRHGKREMAAHSRVPSSRQTKSPFSSIPATTPSAVPMLCRD